MIKVIYSKPIERWVTLTKFIDSGTFKVEIRRPYKRKWVTRRYKPTVASLERVKRIVGYEHGPNGSSCGWTAKGYTLLTSDYWRTI